MRYAPLLLALLLLVLPACIETDETVTLYLAPDGAVELVAHLDDLHSDEKDETKRKKEEKDLLADIRARRFLEKPLRTSGAKAVKMRLLREKAPYVVALTARFADLVAYFRVFEFNDKEGGKTATVASDGTAKKLVLRFPAMTGSCAPEKRDDFPRRFQLILTKGRFTAADGFVLGADGRAAAWDSVTYRERCAAGKPFELSLAWQTQ